MLVTDKQYDLEKRYVKKLDLMVKRISGKGTNDVLLVVDGSEGDGKTEMGVGTCYYISYMTDRKYTINNIFFDLEKVINFAKTEKDQIIHFDEAVLGLLINQRWEKAQQQFIQLVMIARKKRHFILLCIPKFHRLPSYVIEDRAIGLVHVYARRNIEKGRFCYFKRDAKDKLYEHWKKKRIKAYKKFYNIHGTFGEASKSVFTPEEWEEYNRKKDEGILSIGKPKLNKIQEKHLDQRNKLLKGIKEELKLSSPKMKSKLKEWGIDLSTTQIRENCPTKNLENLENSKT